MKSIKTCIVCFAILIVAFASDAFSLSTIEKAKMNYASTLVMMTDIRVSVENFAEDAGKSTFQKIRDLFFSAREDYFGRNYVTAFEKYTAMKVELLPFMEELCQGYLTRTKEILDAAAKETADMTFDFRRNAPFRQYFFQPYDPVKRQKFYITPYNARNYHLFKDKQALESYMQLGYEKYFDAKRIFEDPEIEYRKSLEKKTPNDLDYVLENYSNVIKLCRQSKQYGIEIYKLFRINDLADIGAKYDISTINLSPVIDERIPEEYRIDAADNHRLVFSSEKERLEALEEGSSDKQ